MREKDGGHVTAAGRVQIEVRDHMNKVILMGRLTRDPDIRYSAGENAQAVARYTLAVDRRFRREGSEQTADFIGCVAFGRQAEFAERYLRQGIKIAVTGRIQTGSYTRNDGTRVYTTDVVIEEQEFAESRNASAANGGGYSQPSGGNAYGGAPSGGGSSYAPQQNAGPAPAPAPQPMESADGFMNIPDGIDEELPFQ